MNCALSTLEFSFVEGSSKIPSTNSEILSSSTKPKILHTAGLTGVAFSAITLYKKFKHLTIIFSVGSHCQIL